MIRQFKIVVNAFGKRNKFALPRHNPDGTKTPPTLHNHAGIKASTLHAICMQAGVPRDRFMDAYNRN